MILDVTGLTKRYGNITALDQVDFKLSGGGIVGFVGANGAGKTTALRIMSGLEEPDAGDVRLDGVSIIDYPDKMRRKIGFMPDTLPDASDITVKEYLNFFVNSFAEKDKRVSVMADVVDFTGVDTFMNRKLSDLSKGMKQRVSLARLQIHNPDLMLLDEPAAGLDPRARAELHSVLKKMADKGKMIFLSSHILAELENMVSAVVIIDKGKVLVFAMQTGENKLITVSEESTASDGTTTTEITYYVVQKLDISADAEVLESYRESVRYDMKSSELEETIKAKGAAYSLTENEAAIKLYTIDKLEKNA